MRRKKKHLGRKNEQGIIITLVAVFMLFVIGAMAALSIDVVTIYTARSEAQMAADGAALAGARVLANSGATSDPNSVFDGLMTSAQTPAEAVATQLAQQNTVGGTVPTVNVSFGGNPPTNPTVKVVVQANLPTFFARIWGKTSFTVAATSIAEAYNPSGANAFGTTIPVAPICVKPWLLPNIDPSGTSGPNNWIFDPTYGTIQPTGLLGWYSTSAATTMGQRCGSCTGPLPIPATLQYYPGDASTFLPPTNSLPTCTPALTTNYQESIAGCIKTPISCNAPAYIDTAPYPGGNRHLDTEEAVNCLTHSSANGGDSVDPALATPPAGTAPFEFLAGNNNPIASAIGKDTMVSDSLVTVPVFNSTVGVAPTNPVTIIGFVQLFLNYNGNATSTTGPLRVYTEVINMAGCGSSATGTPKIIGNGASPVAVRLVSSSP